MAHVFREGGVYYVRYKDESGKWRKISAGRHAKRGEAEYLANKYSAREMNRYHKAPVRVVDTDLVTAMIEFSDKDLPTSEFGIDKQPSSIEREKGGVNNVIEYLKEKGMLRFACLDKPAIAAYLQHRTGKGASVRTRREELRLIKKFCRWCINKRFRCYGG